MQSVPFGRLSSIPFALGIILGLNDVFFQNLVLTNIFRQTEGFSKIKWTHNYFMYVKFGGMRITKTWRKCNLLAV